MGKLKFTIISLMLFLTAGANAQITLTVEKNAPRIGDASTMYMQDLEVNAGNGGANQVWDFSAYNGGTSLSSHMVAASEGLNSSLFPGANMVEIQEGSSVETYFSTTTGISIIGAIDETYYEYRNIDDPRELLKFPLSYETSYDETFSGTIKTGTVPFDRAGTTRIEADGYGTLILPYGTFSDVLRIKVTNTYQDKYMGILMRSYIETVYMWYGDNSRVPLASYSKVKASDNEEEFMNFSYLSEESLNASVQDITIIGKPIAFYSIMGARLQEEPESGVYIILYDNGKVEKVIKK